MTNFKGEFQKLRKKLFAHLQTIIDSGEPGKSYEGIFEILCSYPDAWEDPDANGKPDYYEIRLHCYLIGPSRHYDWAGKTLEEAFQKCKNDVELWIKKDIKELSE